MRMEGKSAISGLGLALILGLMPVHLLQAQRNSTRLIFKQVSIQVAKRGEDYGIRALPGGKEYVTQNATVKQMMSLMYKVPMRQITGGPDWLDTDHYNIKAKAAHSYSLDDLHEMFQNLLTSEFQLKFHIVTKEGPVYALIIDKGGPRMKVDPSDQQFKIPIRDTGGGEIVGTRVPMEYFCWWLTQMLEADERPVIDKTGLTRNYDFRLGLVGLPPAAPPADPRRVQLPGPSGACSLDQAWCDELGKSTAAKPYYPLETLPPGVLRSRVFGALREQLGLRLEAQQGPVEYYVIDQAEKPAVK